MLASIAAIGASAATFETYTAPYAENVPTIDGAYDAAWDAAEWATVAQTHESNKGTSEPPIFKILHDDTYIYIIVEYTDTNGTIAQKAKWGGESHEVGAEPVIIALCDSMGGQQEITLISPAIASGSESMGAYTSVNDVWVGDLATVPEESVGFRYVGIRGDEDICYEARIPKEILGNFTATLDMEIAMTDCAPPSDWNCENYSWAGPAQKNHKSILDPSAFGILRLADKGEAPEVDAPATEATEPVTEATEPVTEETEPVAEPVTEGTEPVDTTAPDAPVTEGTEQTPDDADTEGDSSIVLYALAAVAVIVVAVVAIVVLKAKKKAK